MVALHDIQVVTDRIVENFNPDRVILFGSYATGAAHADSDVDLLVILPFEGKSFWKSVEIANRVDPDFSVDIVARSPEDTARRFAEGDPLIVDALNTGKVLYERCH